MNGAWLPASATVTVMVTVTVTVNEVRQVHAVGRSVGRSVDQIGMGSVVRQIRCQPCPVLCHPGTPGRHGRQGLLSSGTGIGMASTGFVSCVQHSPPATEKPHRRLGRIQYSYTRLGALFLH